jgi:hypothetical protein
MVTGPSFAISTSILAPKRPRNLDAFAFERSENAS